MKKLIILGSMILSLTASAETFTECSNATATVRWVAGSGENTAYLTYKGFVTGELEVPLELLNLKRSNEATINFKESGINCYKQMSVRHYTMNVEISASEKSPNVLGSYFPEKIIKTLVLCEERNSYRSTCAKDQ
jgi:hypothetical protein